MKIKPDDKAKLKIKLKKPELLTNPMSIKIVRQNVRKIRPVLQTVGQAVYGQQQTPPPEGGAEQPKEESKKTKRPKREKLSINLQ